MSVCVNGRSPGATWHMCVRDPFVCFLSFCDRTSFHSFRQFSIQIAMLTRVYETAMCCQVASLCVCVCVCLCVSVSVCVCVCVCASAHVLDTSHLLI